MVLAKNWQFDPGRRLQKKMASSSVVSVVFIVTVLVVAVGGAGGKISNLINSGLTNDVVSLSPLEKPAKVRKAQALLF